MRCRKAFLLSVSLFICVNISAQQYPFVHYTPKDGLVNSRVKKAYQDSKGRMYFLTYGGLSVFDGVRFRNYTTQNGLAVNLINDILEVGDDSLLIATNFNSLNALVKGRIVPVKTEGIKCPLINQFYRDNDNKIYLSSDDGLFVMENNTIRELDISQLINDSPLLPYVGDIFGIESWLVVTTNDLKDHKGLYLYDIKHNRICDALPEAKAWLLGEDKANNIWISVSGNSFILDSTALRKGKLSLIPPSHGYNQTKNYAMVNAAFDRNCIWFVNRTEGYTNRELHRIEGTGALLKIPLPEQAASSDIKNTIVDREKNIWLCSDGEGIFKIVSSPLRVFQNPLGDSTQSRADNVYYFNNVTWYNTSNYKLFRRSQKGLEQFNCNIRQAPVVFREEDNKLLAADYNNIYEADLTGQRSIHFRKIVSLADPDNFGGTYIFDDRKTIFTAQQSGLGVWRGQQLVFHIPIGSNDGIERICSDKNNWLWVAKRYTGIDVYSIHPENISGYLQPLYHFTANQVMGSIRSFMIDKTGLIWIGTREHGLFCYKYTGKDLDQLYHFNVGNGLTDNFVTSLACDSFNNIIAGTQTGLDRITRNRETYLVENLSKSNNFFAYIKKVWVDGKNEVYALTNAGVLLEVLSSSLKTEKIQDPQLLLEEIRVNGQAVISGKRNFLYKENNLSFIIAAPSFIDEKRVAFSYLLEGSGNNKWSDTASANSVINLTNLSAGSYLLKIKAFFPSTSYQPAEISYAFKIAPPWWQTWWFQTASGLFIIGLLIAVSRFYYRRKLEKQMAALEKQQAIEKERTRIATDMHDDLGAGLSRIKYLSQSLLNKKKDDIIRPELEKITAFSDEMSEKMGEIIWALNEKNDTIADLVSYARAYASEYLSNHNIQCAADTPLSFPDMFITGEIRRNIFLSVKECLHNIVKHANATKVRFSVTLDDTMQIVIHDNGKGIDPGHKREFSNGMLNIEKRMKEINGKVTFANEQGTKVSLVIPLNL